MPRSTARASEQLDGAPFAPLAVILAFVVGGFAIVPVTLLIAVTALVFGPVQGALYSFIGATLSATVVMHSAGSWGAMPCGGSPERA